MEFSTLEQLKKFSPSIVRDNKFTWEGESQRKRTLCSFITSLAEYVNVLQLSISSAVWYMHRYYREHGLRSAIGGDRFAIATACLFLASKTEENPKQLSEFVVYSKALSEISCSPKRPKDARSKRSKIISLVESYRKNKELMQKEREKITVAERSILDTLGFDIEYMNPYVYIGELADLVVDSKMQKDLNFETRQRACSFINDSLRTPLCLQYDSRTICAGVIAMVVHLQNMKYSMDDLSSKFNVKKRSLADIANQLMLMYMFPSDLEKRDQMYQKTELPDDTTKKDDMPTNSNRLSGSKRALTQTPSPNTEVASNADDSIHEQSNANSKRSRFNDDSSAIVAES